MHPTASVQTIVSISLAAGLACTQLACARSAGPLAQARARSTPLVVASFSEELSPWEATSPPQPPALVGSSGPSPETSRRVGDRTIHRYSGAFRDEAIVLLEEVVGAEGELLVVDYSVLEGVPVEHLRVRMTRHSERVVSVAEVVAGEAVPCGPERFEALMEMTAFSPDRNDGLVARRMETCLSGQKEFECQVSRFDVEVKGQPATLSVARHPASRRDVAGEVTAIDGTVLYKADLLEFQRGPLAAPPETFALGQSPDWVGEQE